MVCDLCGDFVGGKHGIGLGLTAAVLALSIWQTKAGVLSLGESSPWHLGSGVVKLLHKLGDEEGLPSRNLVRGGPQRMLYPGSKRLVRHISGPSCDDIFTRVELNDGWRFVTEPCPQARKGGGGDASRVIETNVQRFKRVFGLAYGGSAVPPFSGGSTAPATTLPSSSSSSSSTSSSLPTTPGQPTFVLSAEEMELNQQSHEAEIGNSLSYYAGPVEDTSKMIATKGHDVGNVTLPDFDSEFRKSCGNSNELVRTTAHPLLSPQECDEMVALAEGHFSEAAEWSSLDSGRFQIAGSWIKDIPALRERFNELLRTKLFPALGQTFSSVVPDPSLLRVQSAYIFKYTPETGEKTDMHMDSSLLSFTILLNEPSEFTGGGTFYESLGERGDVVSMEKGHVTFRPAALRHRGQPITSGQRYVIGGFVTVAGRSGCEHTRQLLTRGTKALTEEADTAKARSLLELARDASSHFSESYVSLAHCLRKMGDPDGALQSYLEAHKTNPRNADAAFMVGVMYSEKGDDANALRWYQLASRLNEYDGDAWYRQGLIWGRQGEAGKEREMYERAVAVQPRHADALCNLGVWHGEAGDADREIALYERALEVEPHNAEALHNAKAAYYDRGVRAYQDGNLEVAETSFRRILQRIAPEEPTVMAVLETVLDAKAKREPQQRTTDTNHHDVEGNHAGSTKNDDDDMEQGDEDVHSQG